MKTTLLIMAAALEQELNSWSRSMLQTISSWTTQFTMRLKLVSIMW